jgi:hypothetical protein
MADAVITPEPQADQSLGDYIRTENAKERAEPEDSPVVEVVSEAAANVEATPEVPATEPVSDEATRDASGKFVKKDSVQARIDKATRNQRDAERRAEQAEARIRELETKSTPAEPAKPAVQLAQSDPEPTVDQFLDQPDPYAAYGLAAGKWAARAERREWEAARAARSAESEFAARAQEHRANGAEKHADFDTVMAGMTVNFPGHVIQAIVDSDHGGELMYYLGTHESEARAVAAASPVKAILTLGQLAARFTAAPSGSVSAPIAPSKAKPLIKPVSASAPAPIATEPDPNKTPFKDWVRIQNAAERRAREEQYG